MHSVDPFSHFSCCPFYPFSPLPISKAWMALVVAMTLGTFQLRNIGNRFNHMIH